MKSTKEEKKIRGNEEKSKKGNIGKGRLVPTCLVGDGCAAGWLLYVS